MWGIVYKAVNKVTGEMYVGQTVRDLETRKREHISDSRREGFSPLCEAIREHGRESFKWNILCKCKDRRELAEKEELYIDYYDSVKNGYNVYPGRLHVTERTREKIREARKRQAPPRTGPMSEEHKRKIGEANRGENNGMYGKIPWNKGHERSEETKMKISKTLRSRGGSK